MGTGSYRSSVYCAPSQYRRCTVVVAWCIIILLAAITSSSAEVVSTKEYLNVLTSTTSSRRASFSAMVVLRRSTTQDKTHADVGSRSAPLMVARGGTNNDDDETAAASELTDNAKQAPTIASATTTTTTYPSTTTNWRTKLRNVVFPIYGEEMTKFLLIGSIKFFVILALTITRDNKDTMVVTECGAEAIAFLKVSSLLFFVSLDCASLIVYFHSTLQDLRSFASSNLIHRHIFKDGKHSRQETIILRHMHSLLCIFLPLWCNNLPKQKFYPTISINCSINNESIPFWWWWCHCNIC